MVYSALVLGAALTLDKCVNCVRLIDAMTHDAGSSTQVHLSHS
jgi:hypothetical protein